MNKGRGWYHDNPTNPHVAGAKEASEKKLQVATPDDIRYMSLTHNKDIYDVLRGRYPHALDNHLELKTDEAKFAHLRSLYLRERRSEYMMETKNPPSEVKTQSPDKIFQAGYKRKAIIDYLESKGYGKEGGQENPTYRIFSEYYSNPMTGDKIRVSDHYPMAERSKSFGGKNLIVDDRLNFDRVESLVGKLDRIVNILKRLHE